MTDYSTQGRDPVVTDTNAYYSRMERNEPQVNAAARLADLLAIRQGIAVKLAAGTANASDLGQLAYISRDPGECQRLVWAAYKLGKSDGINEACSELSATLARGGK